MIMTEAFGSDSDSLRDRQGGFDSDPGHPLMRTVNLKTVPAKFAAHPQSKKQLLDHQQSQCSFSKEVICKVPGSLRIHPSLWSKEDVIHWLRWAEEEYSLSKTDDSKFVFNGRALCLLKKDDFKTRSPSSGDVLYEILQCIRYHRQGLIKYPDLSHAIRRYDHLYAQTFTTEKSSCLEKTTGGAFSDNSQEDVPLNLTQRLCKTQEEDKSSQSSGYVDGKIKDCRLLWDYLYQLLDDKRYKSVIKWEHKELKIFKVVDPNKLAALWGNHKNRPNMTYEKMSRALRQYYKINLLKKESGQRLTFRLLRSPKERLAEKLQQLEAQDVLQSYDSIIAVSP
ncbi:transcription factor ETV7-like [Gastrophryne carolinensis]